MKQNSVLENYGYVWITLLLFIFSLSGHWIFGWYAYLQEQMSHIDGEKINY
ncbi:hypothetical protein KAZ66_05055 [Candidatus Woesebacteria bacterium]|nr:hypothetical protein [Candidatus Woesebacteria bacterium]